MLHRSHVVLSAPPPLRESIAHWLRIVSAPPSFTLRSLFYPGAHRAPPGFPSPLRDSIVHWLRIVSAHPSLSVWLAAFLRRLPPVLPLRLACRLLKAASSRFSSPLHRRSLPLLSAGNLLGNRAQAPLKPPIVRLKLLELCPLEELLLESVFLYSSPIGRIFVISADKKSAFSTSPNLQKPF